MLYHILNGDALAYSFPDANLGGEIIIMREALIDGDLSGRDLPGFWRSRAAFWGEAPAVYQEKVVRELEKIQQAPAGAEFHLWFEYDLFCQVNQWFVLALIDTLAAPATVYAVHTAHLDRSSPHFWSGFGPADSEQLRVCFGEKVLLHKTDVQLGHRLWIAFKNNDLGELTRLSQTSSPAFPHLPEVVQAHIDRFPREGAAGRPEQVMQDLIKNGAADFPEACRAFWEKEPIYGFGDTQLQRVYDRVVNSL